jgi:hypothetical protein
MNDVGEVGCPGYCPLGPLGFRWEPNLLKAKRV